MNQIDWRTTGILVLGVIVGCLLLVVAWKAAKLLIKVALALVFLVCVGVGLWFWSQSAH